MREAGDGSRRRHERANSESCVGLIRTATGLRHGLFPT